jgi:septal ring factor EnvC (AmiA/AmiB activator)
VSVEVYHQWILHLGENSNAINVVKLEEHQKAIAEKESKITELETSIRFLRSENNDLRTWHDEEKEKRIELESRLKEAEKIISQYANENNWSQVAISYDPNSNMTYVFYDENAGQEARQYMEKVK